MSLQMVHARTPEQPALGGTLLSMTPATESTALDSDRAIYYQGNMVNAAEAVNEGALDQGENGLYCLVFDLMAFTWFLTSLFFTCGCHRG